MEIKWNKEHSLRGDIGFGMLLYQLPLGIDSENPVQRNAHLLIGIHILKSQNITTKGKCWQQIVTMLKYLILNYA